MSGRRPSAVPRSLPSAVPTAPERSPSPPVQYPTENVRHEADVDFRLEPLAAQDAPQRAAREQERMRGQIPPPAPAREPRGARGRVRRDDAQRAAVDEQRGRRAQRRHRVLEVLDHVDHHDRVERPVSGRIEVLEQRVADVEAQRLARARGAARAGSSPRTCQPRTARLVEQQAMPAADLQQPPVPGHHALDVAQQPPRGRTPARLLLEVGVVLHVAVEVEQLGARGQRGLLDRRRTRGRRRGRRARPARGRSAPSTRPSARRPGRAARARALRRRCRIARSPAGRLANRLPVHSPPCRGLGSPSSFPPTTRRRGSSPRWRRCATGSRRWAARGS